MPGVCTLELISTFGEPDNIFSLLILIVSLPVGRLTKTPFKMTPLGVRESSGNSAGACMAS